MINYSKDWKGNIGEGQTRVAFWLQDDIDLARMTVVLGPPSRVLNDPERDTRRSLETRSAAFSGRPPNYGRHGFEWTVSRDPAVSGPKAACVDRHYREFGYWP